MAGVTLRFVVQDGSWKHVMRPFIWAQLSKSQKLGFSEEYKHSELTGELKNNKQERREAKVSGTGKPREETM